MLNICNIKPSGAFNKVVDVNILFHLTVMAQIVKGIQAGLEGNHSDCCFCSATKQRHK